MRVYAAKDDLSDLIANHTLDFLNKHENGYIYLYVEMSRHNHGEHVDLFILSGGEEYDSAEKKLRKGRGLHKDHRLMDFYGGRIVEPKMIKKMLPSACGVRREYTLELNFTFLRSFT